MTFPVSVVVPLSDHRKEFFERFCLPSIRANDPAEIFVMSGAGTAPEKRNDGAGRATQPYLLFVDDDEILGWDLMARMLGILDKNADVGFVYSDYVACPWPLIPGSPQPAFCRSHQFDPRSLRESNYIDTTSLLRRSIFPGFDPELQRFQDWDLWLTISERGGVGLHIPEVLFMKFMLDPGISGAIPMQPAGSYLKQKHRIP